MAITLFFDADKRKKQVLNKYASEIDRGDVIWTHLNKDEDKILEEIIKEIGEDSEFKEDLLEDQRPRLSAFRNFSVMIVAIPTEKTITSEEDDYNVRQLAFIITRNRIITISRTKLPLVEGIMGRLGKRKERLSVPFIMSTILEDITEGIIDTTEEYEDAVEKVENRIMKGEAGRKILIEIDQMKENMFYVSKIMRANSQALLRLRVLLKKWGKGNGFNPNIKDRMLYALDSIDTIRESLRGMTNLFMSIMSHRMNQNVYRLTIIGTAFLIPMLVSGMYGMNVPLPELSFWQLVVLSFGITLMVLAVMRLRKWV